MVNAGVVIGVLLAILAVTAVASSAEVVDATEKKTLMVLGESREPLDPGLHFVPPFVSSTTSFDMRTQSIELPTQEAITSDNSPIEADAVLFVRVVDVARARLEVEDYHRAVETLARTTLRAVIGDMELDETLNDRQTINERIREHIQGPTDRWGVRVEMVEVRTVTPARQVLHAMERQSSAERQRRAAILEAQGERVSAVERAEGDRQASVIRAEGRKRSRIIESQGDAVSTVLRGQAAQAMGERAIVDEGLETIATIGRGNSRTVVFPQEFTWVLGRYGLDRSDRTRSSDDGSGEDVHLLSNELDESTRELLSLGDFEASRSPPSSDDE